MLSFNFLKKTLLISVLFKMSLLIEEITRPTELSFLLLLFFLAHLIKVDWSWGLCSIFSTWIQTNYWFVLFTPVFGVGFLFMPLWHSLSAGEFMTRQIQKFQTISLLTQLCLGRFKTEWIRLQMQMGEKNIIP